MNIQTLLLTRFNIKFNRRFTYNNDPAWLSVRFDLFEKYCLPSVINQTSENFKFILFFDKGTPDEFKTRAEGYKLKYSNVEICYSEGVDVSDGSMSNDNLPDVKDKNYVRLVQPFLDESDYILTIRLDNDDAIESTYVENLQNKANEILKGATNLPIVLGSRMGLQLLLDKGTMYKMLYPNNHFIGLLTERVNFMTILDDTHLVMTQKFEYTPICSNDPMWMEIVNGTNADNEFVLLAFPRPMGHVCQKFGFDISEYECF